MRNLIRKVNFYRFRTPLLRFLPAFLLCLTLVTFIAFMLNLQRDYNVNAQIQRMTDSNDLILLDEWQATPYNCKSAGTALSACLPIQATKTQVNFPRTTHMFTDLLRQSLKDKKTLSPNAARVVYRFKINEIDWLRKQRENKIL